MDVDEVPASEASGAGAGSSVDKEGAVAVMDHLDFKFSSLKDAPVVLHDVTASFPKGSRTLLVGDNGAGKSTMLKVLAGKHIHPDGAVEVMGKNAFRCTALNKSRVLLSTEWGRRTVAYSGFNLPIQADVAVKDLSKQVQAAFPERRDFLIDLLQIDVNWRMHQCSDGQRRRVQLWLQLMPPYPLIMLDEISVDLDVLTRADFLDFLKRETDERGATVIYATHIFGGLDDWWTHIVFVHRGRIQYAGPREEIEDFQKLRKAGEPGPLLKTVENWIRTARAADPKSGPAET